MDAIKYVDAFGEIWMQLNGQHTIDMGLLTSVWTNSSYSQQTLALELADTENSCSDITPN